MSFQVPTHFVQQYTTNVSLLLQQKGSKLRNTVTVGSYTGKAAKAVEQVGPVTAQKRTTRHADTPLISTPADARWVFPNDYEWADLIDDQDKLRMLIDPQSSYAQNGAYALGRAMDDEIVSGIFGVNKTGENGTVNTQFDTSNQRVAVNFGASGNVGLTVSKLREAKRILMKNEVDIDNEQLFVIITAKQHDDLLNEAQTISLDYNTRPVLVDGKISAFMGFNFVHCERIPVTADPYRRAVAYAKSGIHLGMWNDINTMISQRDDKSYATQVYVKGTFGATRTEEKKVVDILCNEA
jgi:hypothetical protein